MGNTSTIYHPIKETLPFVLFFFATWFICPIPCIFLFTLFLYKFQFSKQVETWILLFIAISFGLIAYTTQSIGERPSDITRYNFIYSYITTVNSVQSFFISFVVDGGNNVLFYLVTFLMTRLFPNNPQVLPLFWVSLTYFFCFLTIRQCAVYFNLTRQTYIVLIFISFAGIITFYTTTEVIKQTASISIFMYALMFKLQNKKGALFILIVSVLVHFSSMLLVPIYFICNRHKVVKYLPFFLLVCIALSFFNFNVLLYNILSLFLGNKSDLLMRIKTYEDVETWTISIRFYALFAVYILLVAILYWDYYITQDEHEKSNKKSLLIVHGFAACLLLINRSNVHNFIRYILGYFPFYIVIVAQLFNMRIAKFDKKLLIVFVFAFYLFSNIKMISAQTTSPDYGNSYMNNEVIKLCSSNVVQYLQYRTHNDISN